MVFFLIEPRWFFIRGGEWRKPPKNVSYKCTFGMPDQGQMLDVPYKGTYVPYDGTYGMSDQG
jgi:hypothetical protein